MQQIKNERATSVPSMPFMLLRSIPTTDAGRNQVIQSKLINGKDRGVHREGSHQRHSKSAEHESPPILSNQCSGDINNFEIGPRSIPRSRLNARFYDVEWVCIGRLGRNHVEGEGIPERIQQQCGRERWRIMMIYRNLYEMKER